MFMTSPREYIFLGGFTGLSRQTGLHKETKRQAADGIVVARQRKMQGNTIPDITCWLLL